MEIKFDILIWRHGATWVPSLCNLFMLDCNYHQNIDSAQASLNNKLHQDLCFLSVPPSGSPSTPFWAGLSRIFMSSRSPGLIRSQTSKLCHQLQRHLWLDAPEWWAIYVPRQTSYSLLGKEKKIRLLLLPVIDWVTDKSSGLGRI